MRMTAFRCPRILVTHVTLDLHSRLHHVLRRDHMVDIPGAQRAPQRPPLGVGGTDSHHMPDPAQQLQRNLHGKVHVGVNHPPFHVHKIIQDSPNRLRRTNRSPNLRFGGEIRDGGKFPILTSATSSRPSHADVLVVVQLLDQA